MQTISLPILTHFLFLLWGTAGGRGLQRGKALSKPLTSGVTFGQACYAPPGGFTATSEVHSKKKHFFTEKNQKSTLGTSDKQVAAGKKQPGAICLPFPQHLKAFLVLDMSHWKSPLSSDALPLGLFFQTPFDAALSITPQSLHLVLPVPQRSILWEIRGRKVKRAPILGSKCTCCWLMGRFARSPSSKEHQSHLHGLDINSPRCVCS